MHSFRLLRASRSRLGYSNALSTKSSFSDMFGILRWKAAELLTSGMSAHEKNLLLNSLDVTRQQNPSATPEEISKSTQHDNNSMELLQKTVGEAVAAARLEEAKRQQGKWETERETLLKSAEDAARARIESDLVIQHRRLALRRWEAELEAAQTEQDKDDGTKEITINGTAEQISSDSEMPVTANEHPLLGPVVLDLGYKKIYQPSARILSSIPIWKKQRLYRHDRAKIIAAEKAKTPHLGFPGIVVLHEDSNGKLSILDGQHRVGALTLLLEKTSIEIDLDHILVEVYSSPNDNSKVAEDIFIEINKSEPIKLVDMPGIAKASDRNMITKAAESLRGEYPDMFRPSQQCRAPHLNIDNLRDAIFAADVIPRHNLKSSEELQAWIEAQNAYLAIKYQNPTDAGRVNPKALEKAHQYKFYLGLELSWLNN